MFLSVNNKFTIQIDKILFFTLLCAPMISKKMTEYALNLKYESNSIKRNKTIRFSKERL